MPFTRMDQSTAEDWMKIGGEVAKRQSQMPAMIKSMLKQLEEQVDGFSMNQLQHALQTATMAERAGASEELIVAALCHDIGKVISVINHPAIAAEILKPYVSPETYEIVRTHQDFQGKHYYQHFGMETNLRQQHEHQPWFALAQKFTDEWDQAAFDPNYETLPLEHFEPMIDRVFSKELVKMQKAASS